MAAKTRTIYLNDEDFYRLRQIAESLKLYGKRGPGAGEIGNVSELCRRLARLNENQVDMLGEWITN